MSVIKIKLTSEGTIVKEWSHLDMLTRSLHFCD